MSRKSVQEEEVVELLEDEEVFKDAKESPDPPFQAGLRRSARKRKSIQEDPERQTVDSNVGKRHRPLGKMGGVQRSPDTPRTSGQQGPAAQAGHATRTSRTAGTGSKAETITVETSSKSDGQSNEHTITLSGLRAVIAEELNKTEGRLGERIAGVEEKFTSIQRSVDGLEKRVDHVEQNLEHTVDRILSKKLAGTDVLSGQQSLRKPRSLESPSTRDMRFWKARKSLRIWPIPGNGEQMMSALLHFLVEKLRLGEDVLADAEDSQIRRVPRAPASKIVDEVVVEFPTVDLRDVVRGSAYNLAGHPDAGIRLEIAHHLMPNFKALSRTSYQLKQRYPKCKRNIKYDDERSDLVLEFKTDDGSTWKRLRPDQARAMVESNDREELSASDMSEILSAGVPGEEEDEDEYE